MTCFRSMNMSPRNCSVKMSPAYGDFHDEQEGSTAGRPGESGSGGQDHNRGRGARAADQRAVLEEHEVYIRGETLAVALVFDDPRDEGTVREVKLQGRVATVALSRAEPTGVA